ncbi:hypothetical protein BYT27DRAFT_7257427 [Phlegmacium glaucopus]|nr:hypothetical protein BYT27DRAFT_7257427 [Phlegmacium glaucopus]
MALEFLPKIIPDGLNLLNRLSTNIYGKKCRKIQQGPPESYNFVGETNGEGAIGPFGSPFLDDVGHTVYGDSPNQQNQQRFAEESVLALEHSSGIACRKYEIEARAWIFEAQKEAEARMDADDARKREICLGLMKFSNLRYGQQKNLKSRNRIQYDPEKTHFAVCGSPGSGKSSFVNAVRGLSNNSPHAAPTGVTETTKTVTRYPDPTSVLFGLIVQVLARLKSPGGSISTKRLTAIGISIIQNCERFDIPLFTVRSKSDRIFLHDLGHGDVREHNCEKYQEQARQLLIDKTKRDLEANIEEAGSAMLNIFIISSHILYSLVTKKWIKKIPLVIDEARLAESVFKAAYARRYGARAPAKSSSAILFQEDIITLSLYSSIE